MREMNGSTKFLIRKSCGCVLSEASLREMRKLGAGGDTKICPVDGKEDEEGLDEEEWLTINPRGDELDTLKEEWEAKKLSEKEEKKRLKESKKRSATANPGVEGDALEDSSASAVVPKKRPSKKSKTITTPADVGVAGVKAGSSVPLLSATLAAKLSESKKTQSAAIASLYLPKDVDLLHVSIF